MVSAKEEPDAPIPSSMDALLRIHRRILGLDSNYDHTTADASVRVITRLLVADTQAGSSIGRQGLGEPTCVHAAVELIESHRRKFLVHHSILGYLKWKDIALHMQNVRANQNMAMLQSQHHLHGFLTHADNGAHVGSKPQYMEIESPFDDGYEPHDLLLHFENSYQGPLVYGKHASMEGHSSNVLAKQSVMTKQIPLSYANAGIGTSGANISYMRRVIQAAEQLIQNFIAEAASAMQSPPGGSISEEYSPYPVHAPLYASFDASGHVCRVTVIDYGSVYGTDYGY
ncbi:hypothetical protein F3Y22_tig00110858pilonHSYRG00274 [Hibiscus syriacus]|uniref:Uncharacterized protein n=1 Tax=Hibiscus syriacus TaxID=106335 RepID=A0A6A2ZL57_HIBSY|nr:hypothetical protein F3Y22_tig00110858pilonHSYRG00274 [Hibiscus syriacus]